MLSNVVDDWDMDCAMCKLRSYSLVGLSRLCWHFFFSFLRIRNRHELAFEKHFRWNLSEFVGEENLMIKYYRSVVSHKHTHTHTHRLTQHHLSAMIRLKVILQVFCIFSFLDYDSIVNGLKIELSKYLV